MSLTKKIYNRLHEGGLRTQHPLEDEGIDINDWLCFSLTKAGYIMFWSSDATRLHLRQQSDALVQLCEDIPQDHINY